LGIFVQQLYGYMGWLNHFPAFIHGFVGTRPGNARPHRVIYKWFERQEEWGFRQVLGAVTAMNECCFPTTGLRELIRLPRQSMPALRMWQVLDQASATYGTRAKRGRRHDFQSHAEWIEIQ
jgi:hypothetical protein